MIIRVVVTPKISTFIDRGAREESMAEFTLANGDKLYFYWLLISGSTPRHNRRKPEGRKCLPILSSLNLAAENMGSGCLIDNQAFKTLIIDHRVQYDF